MADRSIVASPLAPLDERRALDEAGTGAPLPLAPEADAFAAIRRGAQGAASKVCLRSIAGSLSWGELFERAARWAAVLEASAKPRVALALERDKSFDHIAAMLGGWWAGKCLVPLDTSSPPDRLAGMFGTCGADTLIADAPPPWLPAGARALTPADASRTGPTSRPARPAEMAYVIFTSGSTGTPKGVEVAHRALATKLASLVLASDMTPSSRVLAHHALSADISLMETLGPLAGGGEVYLATGHERRLPEGLLALLSRYEPDLMFISPTGLRMLLDAGWEGSPALTLDVGGEQLPLDLARRVFSRVRRLFNGYGPTEACIKCAHRLVSEDDLRPGDTESIPFGRPLHDVRMFVLRKGGELASRGEIGELAIAGPHLAAGYVGSEAATREKFGSLDAGGESLRIYRTGDLVRWTSSLQLEFMGRADDQVKLHGTRVELAEIAHVVSAPHEVREAVCMVIDGGIAAFLLSDAPPDRAVAAAKESAARLLPDTVRPAEYVVVDRWPLTPSGKLDRVRLQAAAREHAVEAEDHGVERILAGLLGVSVIEPESSLADLGVDSLVLVTLHAKIRAAGIEMSFPELYTAQTLAELVGRVKAKGKSRLVAPPSVASPPASVPSVRDGDVIEMTAAFELFVTRLNYPHYGVDAMWFVYDGAPEASRLAQALGHACAAIPTLRARAEGVHGQGMRWRLDKSHAPLDYRPSVDDEGLEAALDAIAHQQFAAGISPLKDPLFRAFAVQSQTRTGLGVVYHRLLMDWNSVQRAARGWLDALDGPIEERPWAIGADVAGTPPTEEFLRMLQMAGRVPSFPTRTAGELLRARQLLPLLRSLRRVVSGLGEVGPFAPSAPQYDDDAEKPSLIERLRSLSVLEPACEVITLTERELASVRARCDRLRVSPHAVILGAFARKVAAWLGSDQVFPTIVVDAYRPGQESAVGLCSSAVPTLLRPARDSTDAYVEAAMVCLQVAIENRHVPRGAYQDRLSGPPPWTQFVFLGKARADLAGGSRKLAMRGGLTSANMLPQVSYFPDGELLVHFDAGRFAPSRIREWLRSTRRHISEP
jgi:amino acid adenylation domain-containing protein